MLFLDEVKNTYAYSSNRLVSVIGVSDLVIIDTQDALLVADKKYSQNIKNIVNQLKQDSRSEADNHRKVFRPWGYYDSIDADDGFQVKRILVNPGAKLSLQKHEHRAEHWVVVKGVAKVTCGEKTFSLKENQSTYIPKGEVHRLENQEGIDLEIIEIQTGDYLGEDDIIRLEDDYQRN
jgi:Mannose-6-phosphate isomerase